MFKHLCLAAVATLALSACQDPASMGGEGARNEIRIVGSSTVFPFAKAVSERFASADPDRKTPVLESTGTGGGIEQFCKGTGPSTPDIANASRRMKASELAMCQENGVDEVVEIQVGIDGLALAQAKEGTSISLTVEQIYKALAARPYGEEQTATNWSDVDPSLPDQRIEVFGPPTTSGTRDAFNELVMEAGCKANPEMAALKESDEDEYDDVCSSVRTDGAFNEQGENDNLIVQKLIANPDTLGIFGYSYLEENSERLKDVPINGVEATYDSIASGQYPAARPLYIYVKKAHVGVIPGIEDFVREFVSAGAKDGYLAKIGLVSMNDSFRADMQKKAEELPALEASDLE